MRNKHCYISKGPKCPYKSRSSCNSNKNKNNSDPKPNDSIKSSSDDSDVSSSSSSSYQCSHRCRDSVSNNLIENTTASVCPNLDDSCSDCSSISDCSIYSDSSDDTEYSPAHDEHLQQIRQALINRTEHEVYGVYGYTGPSEPSILQNTIFKEFDLSKPFEEEEDNKTTNIKYTDNYDGSFRQNYTNISDDSQNVHNIKIARTCTESINKLLQKHNKIKTIEFVITDLSKDEKPITTYSLNVLKRFANINNYYNGITLRKVIQLVYTEMLTLSPEYQNEIIKILDKDIKASENICSTGKIRNLVNSLNGFSPEVNISLSKRYEVGPAMNVILEKYNNGAILKENLLQVIRDKFLEIGIEDKELQEEWETSFKELMDS